MHDLNNPDILIPLIAGTALMGILIAFIILFIFRYQQKQRSFQKEREQFSQELLQTKVEIQEQTLTNISRELHDNIGQLASLIKIQLNLLSDSHSEADYDKIQQLKQLQKDLITEIKSLSVSLKSENLERFGLLEMIKKDIGRYQKINEVEIKCHLPDSISEINTGIAIFLYRMFQEVMNNIIKHSGATAIHIEIDDNSSKFVMIIGDNGKGFDVNSVNYGSGLINLRERCEMINANLNIESAEEKGTSIRVERNKNTYV